MTPGTGQASRRRARVVLAIGVCFGLGYLAYRALFAPSWLGIDFRVFRGAAAALVQGGPVYGVSPVGVGNLTFRYPPITLLWFASYLLVGPALGYAIHAVGTLVVATVLGLLVARVTEAHDVVLAPIDRALVVSFVAVGAYGVPSLFFGNVNHHVALATGLAFYWLADGRQTASGIALGLAALFKIFPAAFGLWYLHRRSWRAVAAAVATGLTGLGLGALVFGIDLTRSYVETTLLARAAPDAFAGGLPATSEYVSLLRPLSVLLPSAPLSLLTLLAVAIVAPLLWTLSRREVGQTDRLLTMFATVAAVLLVLPSYSLYFLVLVYPLVPLLYVLEGRPGALFSIGTGLSLLTLKLPEVAIIVDVVPMPATLATGLNTLARVVYTLGTPVLWGTLVMLGACLWRARHQHQPTAGTSMADDCDNS